MYFFVDELQTIPYLIPYFIIGFTIPHLLLIYKWIRAKEPKDYHVASGLNKLIMLIGVLFIIFAGQMF